MPGIHQQLQEGTPQLISNLEVLEILKKRPPPPARKRQRPASRVAKKVKDYLQNTPCTRIEPSKSRELLQRLQSQKKRGILPSPPASTTSFDDNEDTPTTSTSTGFGLTHAEAIQCLNTVPTEPVEIHLLIEDLPGRLSDRQQEELLELMRSYDMQKGGAATAIREKHNGELGKQENDTYAAVDDGKEESIEEDYKPAAAEMKYVKNES
eukprot:scaffold3988_cov162-Amphora_coffeaeformis.AAC.4